MLFSIALLAVSLSIDSLGVGIAYGIRKVKIPLLSKAVICFFSVAYSALALAFGKWMAAVISSGAEKLLGIIILFSVGLYTVLQALLKKDKPKIVEHEDLFQERTVLKIVIKSLGITIQVIKNPDTGDIDHSGTIDIKESLLLAFALSVDAIGASIGSAMSGMTAPLIPIIIGLVQLIFLYTGTFLGRKAASAIRINKRVLSLVPGILIMIIALLRL